MQGSSASHKLGIDAGFAKQSGHVKGRRASAEDDDAASFEGCEIVVQVAMREKLRRKLRHARGDARKMRDPNGEHDAPSFDFFAVI
jgi:hypothetical protein